MRAALARGRRGAAAHPGRARRARLCAPTASLSAPSCASLASPPLGTLSAPQVGRDAERNAKLFRALVAAMVRVEAFTSNDDIKQANFVRSMLEAVASGRMPLFTMTTRACGGAWRACAPRRLTRLSPP